MTSPAEPRRWGELLVQVEYGTPDYCLIVEQADDWVLASSALIAEWRGPNSSRHVRLDGDYVTFGTEGKGVGVVTYLIGEPTGPQPGHPDVPSVPLRRLR